LNGSLDCVASNGVGVDICGSRSCIHSTLAIANDQDTLVLEDIIRATFRGMKNDTPVIGKGPLSWETDLVGLGAYQTIANNDKGKVSGTEIIKLQNPMVFRGTQNVADVGIEFELVGHALFLNILVQVLANLVSSGSRRVRTVANFRGKHFARVLVELGRGLDYKELQKVKYIVVRNGRSQIMTSDSLDLHDIAVRNIPLAPG